MHNSPILENAEITSLHHVRETPFLSDIATLTYDTAAAYFDTLFGSRSAAFEQLNSWCSRPSSEYYFGRGHIVVAGGVCAGMAVHIPGVDVPAARQADTLALLNFFQKRRMRPVRVNGNSPGVRELPPPTSHYIRAIAVDVRFRGHGYGLALLETCQRCAIEQGAQELRLDVRADNPAAIHLYERFGLATVGQWLGSTGESLLTMAKPLTAKPAI